MPRCKECGQEVEPRSGVSFGRALDALLSKGMEAVAIWRSGWCRDRDDNRVGSRRVYLSYLNYTEGKRSSFLVVWEKLGPSDNDTLWLPWVPTQDDLFATDWQTSNY